MEHRKGVGWRSGWPFDPTQGKLSVELGLGRWREFARGWWHPRGCMEILSQNRGKQWKCRFLKPHRGPERKKPGPKAEQLVGVTCGWRTRPVVVLWGCHQILQIWGSNNRNCFSPSSGSQKSEIPVWAGWAASGAGKQSLSRPLP